MPAGTYTLSVTTNGSTLHASASITVAAASSTAPIKFTFSGPSFTRDFRVSDIIVTYTNPNNVDVPAEWIQIAEPGLTFRLAGGNADANLVTDDTFVPGQIVLQTINQEGKAGMLRAIRN